MNTRNDRLADLLRRFLDNNCTRQELLELLEMIEQFPDSENLRHVMREQWHAISDAEGIPHAHAKLENLLRASRTATKERGAERTEKRSETTGERWWKQRPARRFAAAAAIALILVSITYLFFKPDTSIPKQALSAYNSQNDIAPGSERAILTLADGTAISLNSKRIGTLAQQGSMQIIKLDSGQLAYYPAGDDEGQGEIAYNTLTTPRGGNSKSPYPMAPKYG
ncbi:hypothetical protein [Anseongella ginsenosidimutans]|uniref:hypothetical protein n=1 Tax=Anseongella ginsenosidimutans TaxID=496056 RepID=UPI0011CCA85D|nr:hypothetical protein [Anseongella ginsenosidimutans]QEC52366.1 hypothetical protein FRZ59_08495 [Anseongella ginsenosidimutans]